MDNNNGFMRIDAQKQKNSMLLLTYMLNEVAIKKYKYKLKIQKKTKKS